ncbi:efflux transporter outer membrane subunit [Qipengyuania sp. JC766]|uniref:efflux transporter outer membrane subunit n=1 Tax=Qipengyuania sp. JC766 TaxID=3232139 RepID=UPI003459762E
MGIVRGAAFAAGLLALSGCTTPRLDPPPIEQAQPLPEQWAFGTPSAAATDLDKYWTLLDDPVLTGFVEQARAQNLDLAQSVATLRRAAAGLRESRAGRLPTVTADGGLRRDFGDFTDDDIQFILGADVSWEADLFGRIDARVDAAQQDLRTAGYSLADIERVILAQVASQTVTARSLVEQLRIARETLAIQDENLQIARWRRQAGLVSSLDVEQARTQRAQTAAIIPQLESDLVATANAISVLIGEAPGPVYVTLTSDPGPIPVPPADVGYDVPAEILRGRPDVRAAESQLAADLDRVGIARAQLLPLVRLSGTVGSTALGIEDVFDIITGNLFAGISQLIFDGGQTRAQIAGAEALADGSLAAWRLSILTALQDVETSSVDLRTSRERLVAFREARDAASNAALLARSQYQAGLIDFQTLLTAESQLLSARQSETGAEAARATSFIALARALGGGWDEPEGAGIDRELTEQ